MLICIIDVKGKNNMEKINSWLLDDLISPNKEKVENAFNIVYKEYSYLIYYVSLKIVKDYSIAEEITNETFYRFYNNKDLINKAKNIKYFLVKIAKNLSLNYIASNSKIVSLHENIASYSMKVDHFSEYIEKFKSFLDEDEVELIILHLLYDFTFAYIAKEKKVSINVVSSKYRRAIKKVKEHYSKGENL